MPLVLKPQKRISEIDFDCVKTLAEELSCEELFAQILYNRGYTTKEACLAYLYPSGEHDPFSMRNMDKLVERLTAIRQEKKTVTVYGDYDVDGTCATAILVSALRLFGIDASAYIPDRHTEGYGLNRQALEEIFEKADLLLTVDCGIASWDLIAEQIGKGREIIVTDHHTIGERLPGCLVLKPGQPGDTYENPDLCGAGIAYKIARALVGEEAEQFADLAGIATVADVVPLLGENRTIVKKALEKLNTQPRECFRVLLEKAGFTGEVNAQTIGFTIAPRMNAAGRMENAGLTLRFLLSTGGETERLAEKLCELNTQRQETEKRILALAEEKLREKGSIRRSKVLVLAGTDWDDGVIGICAARLTEKYHRPCLMFSVGENGMAKGSGRSVEGVDLYDLLSSAADILTQFGGHKMAAGMSLPEEKLPLLEERLDRSLREYYDLKTLYPTAGYDAKAKIGEITLAFCKRLRLLEPCGCGNREVTLRIDQCLPGGIKKIGANQNHLKLYLQDESGKAGAVAFNYEKQNCDYFRAGKLSAIVRPEVNLWQGNESVSLKLADAKEAENIKPMQLAEELTAAFYSRLSLKKTGRAKVTVWEDPGEAAYEISQWAEEDIAGVLILCDHPEYAMGCIHTLEEEAPRFDVTVGLPLNGDNGYHALVMGLNAEKADLTPYQKIVIYDYINPGYADFLAEKAPWAEIYALKGSMDLFKTLFEEYKQLSRDRMTDAYKALAEMRGTYADRADCLMKISSQRQLPMPLLSVALDVFSELDFLSIEENGGFTVNLNKNAQKRKLEESTFYAKMLKCVEVKTS